MKKTTIRGRNEERILIAAEKIFARKGLKGARVSEIAHQAGLPKGNVLYYFRTKEALYRTVIENILDTWLATLGDIAPDDDPGTALEHYIRRKMVLIRERPDASKVFAQEIIAGAPVIGEFLSTHLRDWVARQSLVIQAWVAAGKIDPIEPEHLFFMLWAATQTYADFEAQMLAVLDRPLKDEDFETATQQLCGIILKGLGLR